MTQTHCRCGRPVNGTFLCHRCTNTLEIAIANTAAYYDDLETVRTKQTRYGLPTKGSLGKSVPLPIDARFSSDGAGTKAKRLAELAVSVWTRRTLADIPAAQPPRADTVRSACNVLQANAHRIARLDWSVQLLADLTQAERALQRVIDRPADSWYAGVCGATITEDRPHDATSCGCACHRSHLEATGIFAPGTMCDVPGGCGLDYDTIEGERCQRVLYAEPDNDFVTCRTCNTTWDVKARREWLLKEAEDTTVTVRLLARIVLALGDIDSSEAKLENRISKWVERGKLHHAGQRVVDGRPRPVYRVGDVIDLLATSSQRRSA